LTVSKPRQLLLEKQRLAVSQATVVGTDGALEFAHHQPALILGRVEAARRSGQVGDEVSWKK